ncbi:class I SAM-dependent methyltransferase [Algisphaera agarilytica]|uniref:SAM-dependent methyltransferase n=1 Tax=Algisphaera agarilytica TaxID=1385975 RepID=A0A7X0LLE6_9BACT|nr:class I SAM-dependent methyltransferase [Algisphaera agarilytica]MBB6431415.1 SAM-dependent methyltransferase [Algisphaera agarilytica]
MSKAKRPHRLEIYEHAVQQPWAEAALLGRIYEAMNGGESAWLLREDFAGTCSVAASWCESHPERQAMAVELHGPTLRWAQRRHAHIEDLHLVEADVMQIASPKVDLTAALNFSTFIYHDESALLGYLRHARKGLRPGGVFVMDVFGGPGAQRLGTQTRPADGFTYQWEQRAFDPITHRIDCRIHFTLGDGHTIRSAFRYDWRLWTLPELRGLLSKAGFGQVEVWSEAKNGRIGPAKRLPAAEDWVAYLVAKR